MAETKVLHKKKVSVAEALEATRSKVIAPKLRFKGFDESWETKKVGELCDFIVPGRNKPSSFEGNIPWITTPDIIHNGIITSSKSGLVISKEEAKKIGSKIVPINSVVISCVGDLGLAAINAKEIVINQQLHAFIPLELINYRFLLYALSIQKKYMDRVATKTAVPYMNKDNCNSIPIIHPSLPEQQKIASFLSAVDEKIQLLNRKKQLLEQYKKGVMQQLFSGKLRFKDENGKAYSKWEERKLSDVLFEHKLKSTGKEEVFSVSVHKGLINQVEHLGRVFAAKNTDNYNLVKPNDLVYTKSPTGDFPLGIIKQSKLNKDVLISPLYGVFTPETPGLGYLFNVYFETPMNVTNYLASIIQKGAKNTINITNTTFLSKKMKLPISKEEQNKIGDFFKALDNKIDLLKLEITQTQNFKKGLLQQMFV